MKCKPVNSSFASYKINPVDQEKTYTESSNTLSRRGLPAFLIQADMALLKYDSHYIDLLLTVIN